MLLSKTEKKKVFTLIDRSLLSDKNISAKVFEKLNKYKDLEMEIEKMWHSKNFPFVAGNPKAFFVNSCLLFEK